MSGPKINRYYMDRPDDPWWRRLLHRATRRPLPSFPRTLQIQTFTGCNADCIFCPYGETYGTQPKGVMPPGLFRKIVDEAAEHEVRRVSPYLMNEPLMDRDLVPKIRYINARMPRTRVVLTTNGHFLTEAMTEALLDLGPGLHEIYVSMQGIDKEGYERTMRGTMSFERTFANLNHFIEAQRRRGTERPKLWVTMVDTSLIDARAAVAYWRSRGVAAQYTTLENRGGNIHDADAFSRTRAMGYYTTCTRLFKQAYIMFDGDVVLCCADYTRRQVLGNVARSSLREVWNGPVATEIRRQYLAREFDRLPLCGACRIDRFRAVRVDVAGMETVTEVAG